MIENMVDAASIPWTQSYKTNFGVKFEYLHHIFNWILKSKKSKQLFMLGLGSFYARIAYISFNLW